jgi:hypothetical protein
MSVRVSSSLLKTLKVVCDGSMPDWQQRTHDGVEHLQMSRLH